MQFVPQKVPGVPPAEVSDEPGAVTLKEAWKALSDAQYLIIETSKDYSKALGKVRRMRDAEKEALRGHGFDFEKMLDAQAGMLTASKLVTRNLKAFESLGAKP